MGAALVAAATSPTASLDEASFDDEAQSPKGFRPPSVIIRTMIQRHQIAERRSLATSQRRFRLYADAVAATSPTQP